MHGMGFCCCPTGCDYFTDGFDPPDTTDLGPNYTETAGDWSKAGGMLQISTANARLTCNVTHPTSGTAYRVSVLLQGGEEGDELGAWINNDPTTRAIIVFHTNGTSGRARLRLFVADVLVGETDIYAPPGEQCYLYLCTDGDHIAVGVGGTLYLSASLTVTSSVCGLLTGALDGGTPAKFDNFKLSKDVSDDASCPACGESCIYFAEGWNGDFSAQNPPLSPQTLEIQSGTWEWDGPYWKCMKTSSAGARLVCLLENPSGASHVVVGDAHLIFGQTMPILIADYQDSDNYLFIDVLTGYGGYWGSVPFVTWRFYRRIGGVNQLVGQKTEDYGGGVAGGLAIVVGNTSASGWLRGSLGGYGYCLGKVSHVPSVSKAGIGSTTGGTLPVRWEYFELRKHPDTDPACTVGICPSGFACSHCSATPTAFDVTFASVASEASCDIADPGGCLLWNDTFRCDQDPSNPCRFVYTAGGSPGACSPHHVVLTIKEIGSYVHAIDVEAFADAAETKRIWFRKTYTTDPIACASLSSESIPFQSQTVCAGTPTCSVTAVP